MAKFDETNPQRSIMLYIQVAAVFMTKVLVDQIKEVMLPLRHKTVRHRRYHASTGMKYLDPTRRRTFRGQLAEKNKLKREELAAERQRLKKAKKTSKNKAARANNLKKLFRAAAGEITGKRRALKELFRTIATDGVVLAEAELDVLLEENDGINDDYLAVVVQFGYISMFAPAFPFAPVVGFLANLASIKGRATAWCTAVQRPLPTVVPNIGPWLPIMELMSIVAVAVNLALIYKVNESAAWATWFLGAKPAEGRAAYDSSAWTNAADTSGLFNNATAQVASCGAYFSGVTRDDETFAMNKLWILIAAEHIIIAAKLVLAALLPDEPSWVRERVARDEFATSFQARKAFLLDRKAKIDEYHEQKNAAVKVQAATRGRQDRRRVLSIKDRYIDEEQAELEEQQARNRAAQAKLDDTSWMKVGGGGGGYEVGSRLDREHKARYDALQPGSPGARKLAKPVPGSPWYYKDPAAAVQGPFTDTQMRRWLKRGYLPADLPVRHSDWAHDRFRPLGEVREVFSDTKFMGAAWEDDGIMNMRLEQLDAELKRAKAEDAAMEAAAEGRPGSREEFGDLPGGGARSRSPSPPPGSVHSDPRGAGFGPESAPHQPPRISTAELNKRRRAAGYSGRYSPESSFKDLPRMAGRGKGNNIQTVFNENDKEVCIRYKKVMASIYFDGFEEAQR